jgi:branched-subunit amino acid permease
MNTATKRYLREFIYSMIAYVLTLIPSILAVNSLKDYPFTPARVLVALTPVVPVAFMVYFFIRYLNNIDELQQRIQLLSIGFAAGTTGLLAFSYGFLENVGFPRISLLWVFPILILLWGLGQAYISRRYQ